MRFSTDRIHCSHGGDLGGCVHMAKVAERHPKLTLIIDRIGVAQHPVPPLY